MRFHSSKGRGPRWAGAILAFLPACGGEAPPGASPEPAWDADGKPVAILSDDDVDHLLASWAEMERALPDLWKEVRPAVRRNEAFELPENTGGGEENGFDALIARHGFAGNAHYRDHLARLAAVIRDAEALAAIDGKRGALSGQLRQLEGSLEAVRGPADAVAAMRDEYRRLKEAYDRIRTVESTFPESDIRAAVRRLADIKKALQ